MRWNKIFNRAKVLMVLVLLVSAKSAHADHLKGGWIKYNFIEQSGNSVEYRISFYQYSDCGQREKVDNLIYMAIYDAASNVLLTPVRTISLTQLTTEEKSDFGPCFQNAPDICYLVAEYTTVVTLPANADGYTLTVQRCCRIDGIANVPAANTIGLTYTITIPGGSNIDNDSPVFAFNDAAAVCFNAPFTFDFSAQDNDGDSLVYSLCSGLHGGNQFEPVVENPPAPPYSTIPYFSEYNGQQPMGADVKINSKTGIISGTAPSKIGTYVVAVCVDEYRNGKFISHTRKELHIDVSNCRLGGAELDPFYITCDGYDFTFKNKAGENPDYFYSWDFGVTATSSDSSTQPRPTYTYPDTGVYTVKLKARNNAGCSDSAEAEVRIFPGFATDFSFTGSCIINPYNFKDLTTTRYGFVNSWAWYFGETGLIDDTIKNPVYSYIDTGQKTITLITTNSKGCIDTATKILEVSSGPNLRLNFKDTLICSIDTLQLKSFSSTNGAVFNWSPVYNLIGSGTNQPLVYPKQSTTYNVTVSYKGCVTIDSVRINVTDKVLLTMPGDTVICKTDNIPLVPSTNALYFSWSPPDGLNSTVIKSPVATPLLRTKYNLLASVGKCFATGSTVIDVVPYPSVNAGADATICYGKTVQLNPAIEGSYFTWSPTSTLVNPTSLYPVAGPQSTTGYVLHVTDTLGCPKPVDDTIFVNVIPPVIAFAGNDTTIVRQQPLQLNAKGGANYQWTPAGNLSDPFIANPVAIFTDGPDTVSYNVKVSTPEGCFSNDSIKIYIFETSPQVFIPTAFTPNGDGRNDIFRPAVAGMKRFLYFSIYNRWGQLLFKTTEPNKGWNGTYNGMKQASGTYVYAIEAVDYNDKPYLKKGTFVLIR